MVSDMFGCTPGVTIINSPKTAQLSMRMKPCSRPHTSIIFATGSLMTPATSVETMLVVAVSSCSANELVTYAMRLLETCSWKELTRKMRKILTMGQ